MRIDHDPISDSKYIEVSKVGRVAHSKELKEWLIVDFAKDGSVVGVEILDASKHIGALHVFGNSVSYVEDVSQIKRSRDSVIIDDPSKTKKNQILTAKTLITV